ncbi:uncharacterized protein [Garra rufa]|uniref:uncharacterized protein n=1 Tax=Garra rufa TaxID=137080 RepID=UPI003CCE7D64
MNQRYILLLALWSAFTEYSQFLADEDMEYEHVLEYDAYDFRLLDLPDPDLLEPNITVYRQIEDRENVTVMCKFGKTQSPHRPTYVYTETFDLSVESKLNYTMEILQCSSTEMRVFMVTVSPPASFTCVHKFNSRNQHSQTYNYSGSVLDHHEKGVSSFYICIFSFVAVGFFIITAAVIVIIIRSKTKGTVNTTAVADYDSLKA